MNYYRNHSNQAFKKKNSCFKVAWPNTLQPYKVSKRSVLELKENLDLIEETKDKRKTHTPAA